MSVTTGVVIRRPRCQAGSLRCEHPRCHFHGDKCHEVSGYHCPLQRGHVRPHLWRPDDVEIIGLPPASKARS